MECLWDELCQNETDIQSPDWHGEVLAEREQMLERGEDRFISFDEAKKHIEAMIK